MAKSLLPSNFKDDILANADGKRKYKIVDNEDGTVSLIDVTEYRQEGDYFGATQINAVCQEVNSSFDKGKIIDDADAIKAITEEGYAAGALAVRAIVDELIVRMGGFSTYPKLLSQAEYDELPEKIKLAPGVMFNVYEE